MEDDATLPADQAATGPAGPGGPRPSSGGPDPVVAGAQRLLVELEQELAGLEAALERLESRTYHRCAVCGGPIDRERLAADAATDRCDVHAPPARG